MFKRLVSPSNQRSFFLFGARGSGKTTFLREEFFKNQTPALSLNLLKPDHFERYLKNPSELSAQIEAFAHPSKKTWILIDEIQRVPALLDIVHDQIEEKKLLFALTGSSARKLKRQGANLLAGRASVYELFPLCHLELGNSFDLQTQLEWGSLPGLFELSQSDRMEFLKAYAQTYLKEEILEEQIVRKVAPFRRFLDIAAQSSGQIINYSNIARDCGTDSVTIKSYFEILSDTLIGFFLEAHDSSIRRRQRKNPKFYLFDLGLKRSLEGTLGYPLLPSTGTYGVHFEHFVIQEILRLASYKRKQWQFSYLRTKDDAEIDLIIEEKGKPTVLIEIKSSTRVEERMLSTFIQLSRDFPRSRSLCLSNDPNKKKIQHIDVLPWREGIENLF